MRAPEHYVAAQVHLKKAETAQDPSRLIGLAQGHLLSAQVLLAADALAMDTGMKSATREAWLAAMAMEFGPDGKAVRA